MNCLQSKFYNPIFIIGALILFLILAVAVISAFWPKYEERFFELGLLGRDKKAEGYFLNDNSTIEVGSQLVWYIYVHNHIGEEQKVSVRIKLLNSTMEDPDDRRNKPSPYPFFAEFPLLLSVDETVIIPFSWSVLEAISQNDSIIIKSLMVNGEAIEVGVSAFSDYSFRIVFELWVYDPSIREYRFGWQSGEESHSASTYIWFRVIPPTG